MSFKAMRLLLAAVALAAGVAHGQIVRPLLGQSVQAVIEALRAAGTPFVYSSSLLPPTLIVSVEPTATEPLELARDILAPHGLTLRAEGGAWLVVRAEAQAAEPGSLVVEARAAYAGTPVQSFS